MKFSCTQENLNKGLSIVSHVASKNITLPILNNVLIKAEHGLIKLSATNLEIGVFCSLRGKIEEEGNFTIQARLLSDYINLLPNVKIDFRLEDGSLHIESEAGKTIIKGSPADEFPLIPQVEKKAGITCNVKAFRRAIAQVIFAAAFDESRPEISGVFMNFNKDELVMAATDSYRLAEKKISIEKAGKVEKSVIVPVKTLQELIRVLDDELENIEIFISDNQILFTFNEVGIISRLIEGQYPNYQQIIPKERKTEVKLNGQELVKAVKSASLFCKPGINDVGFEINSSDKKIIISAFNTQVGENITTLTGEIDGENNSIVFNYRYLLDGLQNIDNENVILEFTNSGSPGVIKPEGKTDYIYLIMPIKQ
jgi:DNA polymerase III subunit beta